MRTHPWSIRRKIIDERGRAIRMTNRFGSVDPLCAGYLNSEARTRNRYTRAAADQDRYRRGLHEARILAQHGAGAGINPGVRPEPLRFALDLGWESRTKLKHIADRRSLLSPAGAVKLLVLIGLGLGAVYAAMFLPAQQFPQAPLVVAYSVFGMMAFVFPLLLWNLGFREPIDEVAEMARPCCPACGRDLRLASRDADGTTTCPGCAGVWRFPAWTPRCDDPMCRMDLARAQRSETGRVICTRCQRERFVPVWD